MPFYRVTVSSMPGYPKFSRSSTRSSSSTTGRLSRRRFRQLRQPDRGQRRPPLVPPGRDRHHDLERQGHVQELQVLHPHRGRAGNGVPAHLPGQGRGAAGHQRRPSREGAYRGRGCIDRQRQPDHGLCVVHRDRGPGSPATASTPTSSAANWLARAPSGFTAGTASVRPGVHRDRAAGRPSVRATCRTPPRRSRAASRSCRPTWTSPRRRRTRPSPGWSRTAATRAASSPSTTGPAPTRYPRLRAPRWCASRTREATAESSPAPPGYGRPMSPPARTPCPPAARPARPADPDPARACRFVTDGKGLVNVTLTSSSLSCLSSVTAGSPQAQSSAGSYTVTVDYWRATNSLGGGSRVSNTYTWSSSDPASADPLAALAPTGIVVYQLGSDDVLPRRTSSVPGRWSGPSPKAPRTACTPSTESSRSRPCPCAARPRPASSVGVQVGRLSCVADDNR